VVRLADDRDRDAIARLRRTWTEENAGGPVVDDTFEARFASWFDKESKQRLTWLAFTEAGHDPVGMLNMLVFERMPVPRTPITDRPTQWGYVANSYVLADHRNAGLGSSLMNACTSHADEHGFARLVLSPNERSVPFYLRAGFEPATSLMVRPGPAAV
jgi:GNAT superfamily N-acetyltransferase